MEKNRLFGFVYASLKKRYPNWSDTRLRIAARYAIAPRRKELNPKIVFSYDDLVGQGGSCE